MKIRAVNPKHAAIRPGDIFEVVGVAVKLPNNVTAFIDAGDYEIEAEAPAQLALEDVRRE